MADPNRPSANVRKESSTTKASPPPPIDFTALLNSPSITPRERRRPDPRLSSTKRYKRAQHSQTPASDPSRPHTQSSPGPSSNTNANTSAPFQSSSANPPTQSPADPASNPCQVHRTSLERAYYTARAEAISAQRRADGLARCASRLEEAMLLFSAGTRDLGEHEVAVAIGATEGLSEHEVVALASREGYTADEDEGVWRELVSRNGLVVPGEGEEE